MGSTYANVTVVGADVEAVAAVLAGSGALLAAEGGDVVVYSPLDQRERMATGATAAELSAALGCPAVDAFVFDDDLCLVQVAVGGEVVEVVAAPAGALAIAEDMGMPPVPGSDRPAAAQAAAVVAAVGRGDVDALARALGSDAVFAADAHAEVNDALGLPACAVGWGHRYVTSEPDAYPGPALQSC